MTKSDHWKDDLLVRAMDDELSGSEAVVFESHLAQCDECRQRYSDLRRVSASFESLVEQIPAANFGHQRESLIQKLDAQEHANLASHTPDKVLRRFGWGMAIAAGLALGLVFAPRTSHVVSSTAALTAESPTGGVFEVAGETFVALPYSNPDLPVSAPHIVQMQVPVSSLSDAGIIFEPVSTEFSSPDRSVLADVLLGIDGQIGRAHV